MARKNNSLNPAMYGLTQQDVERVIRILVALITGGLSLLGVIYSNNRTAQNMDAKLDKQQAVTETKLEELTREVRAHNNFAQRVPVMEEQIKVVNHRIADLEQQKGA